MKKYIWFLLIIVLAGIVIGIFIWLYTFRKADLSVASQEAEIEISAADLLNKFELNEENANKVYLGKVIVVVGPVDRITEDSTTISVYLKKADESSGIMCGFNKSTINKTFIKSGDTVRIKGVCTGYLMDVVLNKCAVEK
jgi:hypothetical protein